MYAAEKHLRADVRFVGHTPMIELAVRLEHHTHTLFLKDERCNPTGSIKDRSAKAIAVDLERGTQLKHIVGLVESTSGNMGAALAAQAASMGLRFIAIVDPWLSPDLARKIQSSGGELLTVSTPDQAGNYLNARLSLAAEIESDGPWLWTRQYSNPAVVSVHEETTGPEIDGQVRAVDELYVAVSTCGTLSGLSRYFRRHRTQLSVTAVDVVGSVALGGEPKARRLTGIGAARTPDFDVAGLYDRKAVVEEDEVVSMCRLLRSETGLGVGGSTGAVIAAFVRRARLAATPVSAVAVIADGSDNYRATIYNDSWLRSNGLREPVRTSSSPRFTVRHSSEPRRGPVAK